MVVLQKHHDFIEAAMKQAHQLLDEEKSNVLPLPITRTGQGSGEEEFGIGDVFLVAAKKASIYEDVRSARIEIEILNITDLHYLVRRRDKTYLGQKRNGAKYWVDIKDFWNEYIFVELLKRK